MKTANIKNGSALIMTIVLTALLAIVGVVFVMMARTEKAATSARSDSEELKLAVESIVGTIEQVLAADEPNVPNSVEYYDYPGNADTWLANLEPYDNGPAGSPDYRWRHISDVNNGGFGIKAYNVPAWIRDDYRKTISVDTTDDANNLADADGDGVADSRWVAVPNLTTSKGKPVYAAIRIIDNGGMLNVNTAYQFDPTGTNIDGSSQTQINLVALAGRPDCNSTEPGELLQLHGNIAANVVDLNYISGVIWNCGRVLPPYTPFDISDELEIRYRFLLNNENIDTRLEGWGGEFRSSVLSTPVDSNGELSKWFKRLHDNENLDPNYSYRHLATTYNMDRVIDPYGRKMAYINNSSIDPNYLYTKMAASIDPCLPVLEKNRLEEDYAQIAVNVRDYRDNDSNVTALNVNGKAYYGLERPFMYITEVARNFVLLDANYPNDPNSWAKSYAVELYRQVSASEPNFTDWHLVVNGMSIPIDTNSFVAGGGQYYVARFEDPNALLPVVGTPD
ncbi:MAG: pilus assembly PilX N-terminal domain-containing protein, partial [Sedimentisphaerales bacterium]|nr:pilus assembly PilX N-terminal domain-containing protein [Sedimentisphaerales bacterium]